MTSTLAARLSCPIAAEAIALPNFSVSRQLLTSLLTLDWLVRRSLLIDWYICAVCDG
jgi:hypothetical protein